MEPVAGVRNTATAVLRQSLQIQSSSARWLSLHLHAVLPSERSSRAALLLHGATLPSYVFDLPVPGYSLQERLAAAGWARSALDDAATGNRADRCPVLRDVRR